MIVSAIADPSIFGPLGVTDELTSREVLGLLRGILLNGVLLSDPARQLIRDAMTEADRLSKQPGGTQRGQRIALLLQELYKQHKKYIVSCEEARWNATNPSTIAEQIVALHEHLKADVVVAPENRHAALRGSLASLVEVVAPQDISISRYETLRLRLVTLDKPLDEMQPLDVEECIGRAVKYCNVLRVYDYLMVAREKRTCKYRDGIQFVLAIWTRWCVVGASLSRTAELYTVGNTHTQDGFLTGAEAKTRLANGIVTQVIAAGGCHSTGHVMDDNLRLFHARGFEAKKRAFTIDPGFDALGPAGPVRRCLLKADVAAELHFEQCRKLRCV